MVISALCRDVRVDSTTKSLCTKRITTSQGSFGSILRFHRNQRKKTSVRTKEFEVQEPSPGTGEGRTIGSLDKELNGPYSANGFHIRCA